MGKVIDSILEYFILKKKKRRNEHEKGKNIQPYVYSTTFLKEECQIW